MVETLLEIVIELVLLCLFTPISLYALYCAVGTMLAVRDVLKREVREAMVIKYGYELRLDVAGVGVRELKVADLGKYEAHEVVKEGEMWTVYYSKWIEKALESKEHKFVFLTKDKFRLLLSFFIQIILLLGMSAGFGFLIFATVNAIIESFTAG